MDTQDLSLSANDVKPDLSGADQECLTTATAREVIDWLVACRAAGTLVGLGYRTVPGDFASDGWYGSAHWLVRALFAFKASRSVATPTEDENIEQWLWDQADYMATMLDSQIGGVFPSRLTGDYSDRAGVASTGATIGYDLYQGGPDIPTITIYYNNRRSSCAHFVGQAGIYLNDSNLLAAAKRYIKEWVMFGVWEDGIPSEWQRNEGSADPKQGLVYNTHNMACALEIAARTAELGDRELADFSTTYGIWGTESTTPKTIYTALDKFINITQGGSKYSDPTGRAINWWTNNFGLACHWQYLIHPANSLGIIDKFSTIRQVVTPSGWTEDHYFAAWRGYCAIYPSDVRVGLPDPIQHRIG